METQTIRLPNGRIIENVPVGTSKDLIKQKAIAAGLATEADFGPVVSADQEAKAQEDLPWYVDAKDFLKANMEIPVGLGGALTGAAAGSVAGPVGALVGGVIGGALGSGGGSLLSDELEGKDLDYAQAVKEAAISAGFDIATLGLGKVLKPAFVAGRRSLGFTPKETAEDLIKMAQAGKQAGSQESLMASQQILTEGGATLLPYQTRNASGFDVFKQRLGEVGILSSSVMEENARRVNSIVNDSLDDLITRYGSGASDPSALGENMYQVIQLGKSSMQDIYNRGLTDIQQSLANKTVPTGFLKKSVENFIKENQREFGSLLDKDALKVINDLTASLDNVTTLKASSLLDLEKKIAREISKFGDLNSGVYNSVAERDLAQLSSAIREAVSNTLKTVDPAVAAKYSGIKKEYSQAMAGILPELNKSFIKRATKENYESLGKMLLSNGNIDNTRKLFASLDSAFALAKKSGAEDLPFESAKQAKQAVRSAYLKNMFPSLGDEFSINKYKNLADRFSKPAFDKKMKVILGEDYSSVKQMMNLMKEASEKPSSNIGELVLRNKEYTALFGLGAAATGGAVGGVVGGGVAAGAVLLTPILLAKLATNPKAVNKMLAFNKRNFKNADAAVLAGTNLIGDLIRELPEEDQAEIKEASRM